MVVMVTKVAYLTKQSFMYQCIAGKETIVGYLHGPSDLGNP